MYFSVTKSRFGGGRPVGKGGGGGVLKPPQSIPQLIFQNRSKVVNPGFPGPLTPPINGPKTYRNKCYSPIYSRNPRFPGFARNPGIPGSGPEIPDPGFWPILAPILAPFWPHFGPILATWAIWLFWPVLAVWSL